MDLTLTETWNLWWSGKQLADHTLYGIPILWLSRAGKLLAFLAGTTIILDTIGPERLHAYATRAKQAGRHRNQTWAETPRAERRNQTALATAQTTILLLLTFGLLHARTTTTLLLAAMTAPTAAAILLYALPITSWATQAAAWTLEHNRLERTIRAAAAPLFLTGFTLDFLAA